MVEDFKAFDADGAPLPVRRAADSQYVVDNATRLKTVTYLMNDTFDDEDTRAEVFNPAGTSFQGDSVFVFNHCGVVGYIQGQQSLPYTFNVTRPEKLYCATALEVVERSATKDVYMAPTYDDLVDGPVMYSKPDTARFNVEGVDVLTKSTFPVHSPSLSTSTERKDLALSMI